MLFPALFALGGAFFFFVLRVQGADGSFPKPLTPDEEAVLLRRMQQDGDAEAREKLIEHNLRLVAHIVKKYYAVSTEQDDLLSIGTIGLIKAVNTFKADKNIRLATYASKCIQNELLMYFRQKRKSAGELSLSDTLESDGDGNALALQDIICCEDSGLSAVEEQDRYHAMHRALAGCLSPREREILMMLAKGHDTEFMQDKLFISKSTIKSHTYNIYKKVDVHSRKELINLIKDMDEDDQKPRRAKKATRS